MWNGMWLYGKREPPRKQTMREIIETLWNMELGELRSSLKAVKGIAAAAKQEKRSDNTDPLPPINLEYTSVDVPLYSSDNGNGNPNPQVHEEPKLADDTHNVVHKETSPASVEPSVDDKSCKQKLMVDAEFIQRYYKLPKEISVVEQFLEVWDARMEEREKRKKLWKPYEKETHQLLEQSLAKINAINEENFQWLSFYNTTLGEKECSDWLEAVRAPIARVKQQLLSLPDRSHQNYLKEVYCLHGYSLVAWLTVYKACQRVKTFSVEMQTDFLQRMLRNLVTVSDQLFRLLNEIDTALIPPVTPVSSTVFIVDPSDVMTPSELREMEKSLNEDEAIEDPRVYQNVFINIEDFI